MEVRPSAGAAENPQGCGGRVDTNPARLAQANQGLWNPVGGMEELLSRGGGD